MQCWALQGRPHVPFGTPETPGSLTITIAIGSSRTDAIDARRPFKDAGFP